MLATTVAANAQHLDNETFDSEWVECYPWVAGKKIKTQVGNQPKGWNAANIYGMNGTGQSDKLVTETTGRENTGKAVKIQNVWAGSGNLGSWAPGYLTLGTPWNTSVGTSQKDGGTFGGIDFTYKPDAISFYYKWNKEVEGKASFIGYLWNGTYKQDNVPSNVTLGIPTKVPMTDRDRNILGKKTTFGDKKLKSEGTLVASYEEYIDAAATSWTKKTIEFNYKNEEEPEKLNLIFCSNDYFTTNVTKAANALIIDDVTLVYYKHLSSLKINGVTPKDFIGDISADNETTVKISATDTEYTEGCVEAIAAGKGATTYGEYNPLTAVYTIVVTAGDESTKTYEIQFKNSYDKKAYTNSLLVEFNGYNTPISTNTIHLLSHQKEEKYGFVLENFNFNEQDMGMIYVKNLTKTQNSDGTITYANNEPDYVYIKGLGETLPISVTSNVDKNDVMTATITIDLSAMIGGVVTVTYGPQLTINPAQSLETTNSTGITNVVMTRTFKAGWNTYCMPFDYNVADLGTDVKVQEFVSANDNGLNFAAISDGVLKANNPYLVFFPAETVKGTTDEPVYFATTVNSYTPTPVTYGAYTFSGNYTAGMNMNGYYGVADFNGVQKLRIGGAKATLPAGCAYFATTNNANGMLIRMDGGNTTGILDVNTGVVVENTAVYNLQGVKVSNNGTASLPAGIYVMGGKKVIVK